MSRLHNALVKKFWRLVCLSRDFGKIFLEVQTKYAKKVSDALNAISDGNQKSIYSVDMMIEVINGTMHYQKNNQGTEAMRKRLHLDKF